MFSFKNKIDPNLNALLSSNTSRCFRVLIHCTKFINRIESRLKSYKCTIHQNIEIIDCLCADVSSLVISRLIEYPEVDYITFDGIANICAHNILSANNIRTGFMNVIKLSGKGIGIGIIDTGVYPHKDLKQPSSKICKFVDLINELNYPYDDNGHGTFISGLIAGSGASSNGKYRGIAPDSAVYMIKAFEASGRAYISTIFKALILLINESKENNIRIICLPFETFSENSFILSIFSKLFKLANDNNIVVVVPSGSNKNNKNSIVGIATLSNCITVAGVTAGSQMNSYTYSSAGPLGKLEKPNLCAACTDLCSLNCDTSYISERKGIKLYARELKKPYTNYEGTSCAAAFVAGVFALLLEKKPELSPRDATSLVKTSCKFLKLPKWQQGLGYIDLENLFQ